MILATGGESHLVVMQDAFLGTAFYRDMAEHYDYMLRGDEVWGWGDYAINHDMTFWECRLFNLNELVYPRKLLKSDKFDLGVRYLSGERRKYTGECLEASSDPNDIKDYLYWRHREARLLQNMAYLRRCYIPHFTPFLFNRTLSVIRKIPGRSRVQKRLFMKMGRMKFPDLFLDKKEIVPYASDINNFNVLYQDKKFQSFLKSALLESNSDIFNNAFERKTFEGWIASVFTGSHSDIRTLKRSYDLKSLVKRLCATTDISKGHMKALLVRKGMNAFPVLDVNYLFRLTVLSLALQEYESN